MGARRMTVTDQEVDKTTYEVVINQEEQYSIWPARRELPRGWQAVGVSGTKSDCLSHIKNVWTDMRPLSLRQQMQAASQTSAAQGGNHP
jgi:MbtH protein